MLINLNFATPFIKIISSFLIDRSLRIKINSRYSREVEVRDGVPQGSILGPFLFNLYLHDIPTLTNNTKSIHYADDTIILSNLKRPLEALWNLKENLQVPIS